MKVKVSFEHRNQHRLRVAVQWEVSETGRCRLNMPYWRPGRYERANNAGNVFEFTLRCADRRVECQMINENAWEFEAEKGDYELSYCFYADTLNAGSSYVDDELIYLNPINWLIYPVGAESDTVTVNLLLPEGMTHSVMTNDAFEQGEFPDLHAFLDAPFIASRNLRIIPFNCRGYNFELVVSGQGHHYTSLIQDFTKFTEAQLDMMGTLPVDRYKYFILEFPHRTYHGVEHQYGCVMTFGPYFDLAERSRYLDFIGLSSHELFHVWNVKAFRDKVFSPYNYEHATPSDAGFALEGFTTYYGDLFLWRSGVMNSAEYFSELKNLLDRYLVNFGRTHLSLAESSRQTWVDGYGGGAPERRVSIYNEGALFAFLLNVEILRRTDCNHGLDALMQHMFKTYTPKNGYTRDSLIADMSEISGSDMSEFINELLDEANDWWEYLVDAFDFLGVALKKQPASSICASRHGLVLSENRGKVLKVHPNSILGQKGVQVNDEILAIGELKDPKGFEAYLKYWQGYPLKWTVCDKKGRVQILQTAVHQETYYEQAALDWSEAVEAPNRALSQIWGKS